MIEDISTTMWRQLSVTRVVAQEKEKKMKKINDELEAPVFIENKQQGTMNDDEREEDEIS